MRVFALNRTASDVFWEILGCCSNGPPLLPISLLHRIDFQRLESNTSSDKYVIRTVSRRKCKFGAFGETTKQ